LGEALTMPAWRFKLLYDGECPFCRREVEWLRRRDRAGRLAMEDISALGFDPATYGLSREEVVRVLHGVKLDGTVLKGMDAVREAYRTVGLGWLVAEIAPAEAAHMVGSRRASGLSKETVVEHFQEFRGARKLSP
jgi:predicted DCC family thiol-disulfide oxidoreductase YuxK